MTGDVRSWLDELDALRAAGTDGPWFAWNRGVGWHLAVEDPAGVDHLPGRPHLVPEGLRTDLARPEDAALIVAAVNNLPRLTAIVRGLTDLADELETDASLGFDNTDAADRIRAVLNAGAEQ